MKATEGVWAYQQYQGETTIDDYQVSPQYADMSIPHIKKIVIYKNDFIANQFFVNCFL
jgi:hypothetical protein